MKSLTLGGIEVELIDTAGWQDSGDTIERQAQQLGSDAAAHADVILWCDERGKFNESDANRLNATGAEVIRVRTKADLSSGATPQAISTSAITAGGTDLLQAALAERLAAIVRPALAPSQSRCRHHVVACANHLRAARDHVAAHDPPELAASALRAALDQLGELTGAVYTNDLLDRIFSRFCIGK
jgi:tRNA modification GTPase